ncbi:MAG: hypothetical protein ACUVUU_00025 [bacterium]
MLANPGFEEDLIGWGVFGNVYHETTNPPQFVPYEGNGLVSMFGNWSGPWNVSGIFQEFPACPGAEWSLSAKSRHWSQDPLIGQGAPNFNWVVQKIAWFDANHVEIGGVESTILDGTFPTDVWFDNDPIVGTAPEGTVSLQALILYIQPAYDGGAAHIDLVELLYLGGPSPTESATWGSIKRLFK